MRILLIGSGGREHALAWKISKSPLLTQLWIAPGNPGTALHGENVAIAADDVAAVVEFATANQVDLVVVGPEGPLVNGMVDALSSAGIAAFGPSAEAAELEGSKAWCKEVLVRHRVPTGDYRSFTSINPALSYLNSGARYPLVVKASGLAAGKGVIICQDVAEARVAVREMLEGRRFGDAGSTVLLEEFLEGPEASAFCLTDGRAFIPLETCQDHKALLDGDRGPNTGGMGAVSPNPEMSDRMRDTVERHVLLPTLHGMNREGRRFQGMLFAGLMLTAGGPKVLEYNVRFGDPECQVLMMRFRSDIVPYLDACARGTLEELDAPEWDQRPACTVILASGGYPESYPKGLPIEGVDGFVGDDELQIFQAGTARDDDGRLVTAGGRVLAVTTLGSDMADARARAYAAVEAIKFEGMTYRSDIGAAAEAAHDRVR